MKILLTGIAGNLGYEVADYLNKSGHRIVPLVHTRASYKQIKSQYNQIIIADLLNPNKKITIPDDIDSIIHCAGIVNLKTAGYSNQKMMQSIIKIARVVESPIFHVSTAFLFKRDGNNNNFYNAYERDKYQAEKTLYDSQVPSTTIRPSVLVGQGKTGAIRNFSGYYLLVKSFYTAARLAEASNNKIRFPALTGTSNMVPVDQVAAVIGKLAIVNRLGKLVYATNPDPPKSAWVLEKTLNFFNIKKYFDIIDCDFTTYAKMVNTPGEEILYRLGLHLNPYWTLTYNFPESICSENLIDEAYLNRTLQYYRSHVRGIE